MKIVKTTKEQKLLSSLNSTHYLDLSHQHLLTNHRKIPCSKYSGRYIILFEDTFCFHEVMPTEEDVEPP